MGSPFLSWLAWFLPFIFDPGTDTAGATGRLAQSAGSVGCELLSQLVQQGTSRPQFVSGLTDEQAAA